MKRTGQRAATFLMALLMTVSLTVQHGAAVLENVYFSAVNDQLMPLNAETMPFYSGNTLYVCQTMFDGTDIGVRYIRNYSMNLAALYTSSTMLQFYLATQSVSDKDGNPYPGKAIEKGGYIFFPLELACKFFGLNWSISETPTVPLVRITNENVCLDDRSFISAAASMMAARYAAYEKLLNDSENNSGNGDSGAGNDGGDTPDTPPPIHAAAGQKLYLLLRSTSRESTFAALHELDGSAITFLMTAEQMQDGDLIRAILGNGHAIALYVQSTTEDEVLSEIQYAREQVRSASCALLQLVWYNGAKDISSLLQEQGLVSVTATLDHSKISLKTDNDAKSLLRLIGKYQEDLSLYLGSDTSCSSGLGFLLNRLSEAQYRLCSWRLTH